METAQEELNGIHHLGIPRLAVCPVGTVSLFGFLKSLDELLFDVLGVDLHVFKNHGGGGVLLADESIQKVLGTHVGVVKLVSRAHGVFYDLFGKSAQAAPAFLGTVRDRGHASDGFEHKVHIFQRNAKACQDGCAQ